MTSEILAKSKGWLYLFLSKILSEPLASELFCALQNVIASPKGVAISCVNARDCFGTSSLTMTSQEEQIELSPHHPQAFA